MSLGSDAWRSEPLEGGERFSCALAESRSSAANDAAADESEARDLDWRAALMRLRDKWMGLGPVPQWLVLAAVAFPAVYLIGGDEPSTKPPVATAELTADGYVRFKFNDNDARAMSDDEMKTRLAQAATSRKPSTLSTPSADEVGPPRREATPRRGVAQHVQHPAVPKGRPLAWYGPGGTIAVHGAKKPEGEALPMGTRFWARLEVGVLSTSTADVVAKVDKNVEVSGKTILRKGDVMLGRATVARDDSRIMLDFHAVYSGPQTITFRGYAIGGGVPGVVAERRGGATTENDKPSAADKLADFTKDVVGDAVSGGSGPLRAADRHFVQGSLERGRYRQRGRPAVALMLPAGTEFEVIVSR